jgi:hypothetical protein
MLSLRLLTKDKVEQETAVHRLVYILDMSYIVLERNYLRWEGNGAADCYTLLCLHFTNMPSS